MPAVLDIEAPPPAPPADKLVTAEELSRHPEWGPCELVRGKVVPMCRPNSTHGLILHELSLSIGLFVRSKALGKVFEDSGLFIMRDPDTVRGPDLHFIRSERWPGKSALNQYPTFAPDLCVEVVSPNDEWSRIYEKVAEYRAFGVALIWLIDPEKRTAAIFRANGTDEAITKDGVLSGEDILPGFTLPLTELFAVLD